MANISFSDALPVITQGASTVLSASGDLAKGDAALVVGQRKKQLADFEAAQYESQGGQEIAAAQRQAADEATKTALINSAALARAAASGAGASDPTVISTLARTAGVGAYRQSIALYNGEAAARLDNMKATALRYGGDTAMIDAQAAKDASRTAAASTALSGLSKIASLASKFWTAPDKVYDGGTGGGVADTSDYAANDWMSA